MESTNPNVPQQNPSEGYNWRNFKNTICHILKSDLFYFFLGILILVTIVLYCKIDQVKQDFNKRMAAVEKARIFESHFHTNTFSLDSMRIVVNKDSAYSVEKYMTSVSDSVKYICDSLVHQANINTDRVRDSLFLGFNQVITSHVHKLDNALADIRQETNNNLTQVETRVTLWIGVLAIIGAFIPLVVQLNMRREIDKKMEEMSRKEGELKNTVEDLEFSIKKNLLINGMDCLLDLMKTLNSGGESNEDLRREVLGHIKAETFELLNEFASKDLNAKERCELLLIMIEYKSVFRKLHPFVKSDIRLSMEFIEINDWIGALCRLLLPGNHPENNDQNIKDYLIGFMRKIERLPLVFPV